MKVLVCDNAWAGSRLGETLLREALTDVTKGARVESVAAVSYLARGMWRRCQRDYGLFALLLSEFDPDWFGRITTPRVFEDAEMFDIYRPDVIVALPPNSPLGFDRLRRMAEAAGISVVSIDDPFDDR